MSSERRPRFPFILTANDLLKGSVTYRTDAGWSPYLADALVADDPEKASLLEAVALEQERVGDIIEPEFVTVERDGAGRLVPLHYRERIRALGPTVRMDLGPQAQGLHTHVSL